MRQIVYDVRPERLTIIILIFIVILWNVLSAYYGASLSLFLLILLLAIGLASIQFKFQIHDNRLVYQLLLFKKSIFKKTVYPEQINQVKFFRFGWSKKAAIIKVNKGINIRLAVLEPPRAYEYLLEFAKENDITIFKTKDYLILDRMKK